MQLLQNTRRKLGEYFLKKELANSHRNSIFQNFEKSATIGILFNATNQEDFELVKKYVNYLKGLNKKVKALGYFSKREMPELTYSKFEFDFFTKKDLNWHLKPDKDFIDNFINEEFDILLVLDLKDDFPLRYISALSKAKFKMGNLTADTEIYDMMIEVEEGKGIKYFLKHLDHYLMQLNKNF
ncbi:MAG: hypothetical protein H0X62_13220 [Bacteroidetes bacterium]|nr:hypothetical protein [Bacteroidota bacterium]